MPVLPADRVAADLARGHRFPVDGDLPSRVAMGQRVRARKLHPIGPTRLPRDARGHLGAIARDRGVFVDASSDGRGKIPPRLGAVRFGAQELWGEAASPWDAVYPDLWDDHLEPAP